MLNTVKGKKPKVKNLMTLYLVYYIFSGTEVVFFRFLSQNSSWTNTARSFASYTITCNSTVFQPYFIYISKEQIISCGDEFSNKKTRISSQKRNYGICKTVLEFYSGA